MALRKLMMNLKKLTHVFSILAIAAIITVIGAEQAIAANAGRVVSYNEGTGAISGYNTPSAALGSSPTDTGSYQGTTYYVTPFNNPWSSSDVVSVGLGGHITLELENYVMPLSNSFEIGVFAYQALTEESYGCGYTTTPAQLFRNSQSALVDVSTDNVNWLSLNSGNEIIFDIPANAFQDSGANIFSDYGLPFTASLANFEGKTSLQETIDVYNGSAGGTWLDISNTGLSQVGYIRFTVPSNANFSFELEGISIASNGIGAAVPEPSTIAMLIAGGLLFRRRKIEKF